MTPDETVFRSTRLARLLTRAPLVLSKHLWVWPVLGAVLLGAIGLWVRNQVEGATKAELADRLQTLLKADIAALRLWFSEQEADAKSFAADVRIQGAIVELAALAQDTNTSQAMLLNSAPAQTLQYYLQPLLESQHYLDYIVVSPDKRLLAGPHRRTGTRIAVRDFERFIGRALSGRMAVSRPFAWELSTSQRSEGPIMFVAAPVKETNGAVVAVLGLRMKPEEEFSRIFSVARMGKTGEAYAFDRRGVMLTASRFDAELKALGLIPNRPEATAILNLRLVDPGADLHRGERPAATSTGPGGKRARAEVAGKGDDEAPLTRMAAAATRGWDGCDVEGYRNYRGVKVVGAWQWLPEYGMGVATEVAAEEGFRTLYVLRQAFLVMFGLLLLSGVGIFASTLLVERLQASARKSAVRARRLGQYVLVQEIGRGANGMVYRARHTLLRRPVAVKLLSPEVTNEATVARFEHEVQMTSQLTHPNTVAIYDYGRTPDGLFYYAMEYLSGIDLDQLVRQFGAQPEGRVIHILRQICGSLAEAHGNGLIHRDVKPANIVLTRRGGVCDMVKVLDFGLAKEARPGPSDTASAKAVVGTPHFMAPEAVQKPESVGVASDLYSVGAVGYWLLTGQTVFDADNVDTLFAQLVKEQPPIPSERLGRHCSADLEGILLQCLSKAPTQRPASARVLAEALAQCAEAGTWTAREAEEWWRVSSSSFEKQPVRMMPEKTLVIAART